MGAAFAHPHIWIDARVTLEFNENGAISAIHHQWTFDDAFSAWSIQGLDTNGDGTTSYDELQPLAQENMIGLREYEFYTFAGEGSNNVRFSAGPDPEMTFDGHRTTLSFTIVPDNPVRIARSLEIDLGDPEYYADFSLIGDVQMQNAPANCTIETQRPQALDPTLQQKLIELGPEITELPADLKAQVGNLGNTVYVSCPGGSGPEIAPVNAQQATEQLAQRSTPFVAPPAETGLPLAKTGLLGWINVQQQKFYMALTSALSRLKADNTAFWVLGTLSFLYGVFHSAGPGHGKVVISSYVLATRAMVGRGVLLSFASAMLQSVVAIVFVLIAAVLLRMTSIAMSEIANLVAIGSYALVALLGAWLLIRHIWPGHEDHAHHDHGAHAHAGHDHKEHKHVVTPQDAKGSWQEALGVVFSVGIRPCSGALVVLVFALSQDVLMAGILSVFLMGLGTALTVAFLATFAVAFRDVAQRLAGGPGSVLAVDIVWWLELAGALLVFGFGILLLFASL